MTETKAKKLKSAPRSRAWWSGQIDACEKSGMSMAAYAKLKGLSLSSLYNWKTTLRRGGQKFTKTESPPHESAALRFLEVSVEKPNADMAVEIVSPNGWTVRIPSCLDTDIASRFLSLIGGR